MDERLEEIFSRYEQGTASEQEKKIVDDWFASFDDTQPVSLLEQHSEKERLRTELFSRVMSATRPVRVIRLKTWMSVAAAVLVMMISGLAFYLSRPANDTLLTAVTGTGAVKKIILADGSEIWLNAAGRIRYPEKFDKRTRDIYLDEGEAFFNVKHKADQPFIVHSGSFATQVLGTSFNIQNYKALNSLHVFVRTGKVSVSHNGHLLQQLINDQEIIADQRGTAFNMIKHAASDADSWTQGIVELQDASFAELALKIKNAYNMQLRMQDKNILSNRYTLQLNLKDNLENNLNIICKIHHLNYRRVNNEIIIY